MMHKSRECYNIWGNIILLRGIFDFPIKFHATYFIYFNISRTKNYFFFLNYCILDRLTQNTSYLNRKIVPKINSMGAWDLQQRK